MHPITHPVPFVGIEGGRRGKIESFADAYKFLGHAEDTLHPGHPREPSLDSEILSRQSIIEAAAPCLEGSLGSNTGVKRLTVQNVNSLLYHLAPRYTLRQPGLTRCTPCYKELGACVSLICENLLAASDKVGYQQPQPPIVKRTFSNALYSLSLPFRSESGSTTTSPSMVRLHTGP